MARAIWKGTLGFGLVNIGVELLTANKSDELDLDLLDRRDHARIGYQKYNKSTGEIVEAADIVRGFAVAEDEYVVLSDEDLKAANPKATQSIDIVGFVDESEVPRIFYDKPYFISPVKGSERAYALLRDALRDSAKLALAQIVIHTRQHMAAVYAFESVLVVQLLRYAADLKDPEEAGVTSPPSISTKGASREVAMASQLIASMHMEWTPEEYRDTYRDDLLKLVKERAKHGGKRGAKTATVTSTGKQTKVLDLVAALQKSLGSTPSRKAARSTRAATKPAKVARKATPRTRRGRVA